MRYSEDFIEKVRSASNLVDIISQYTQLKTGGRNMMGLCPFPDHNEKSPSFSVSPDKQLYHCFGCKKSGNVFTFLQQYNGQNFVEALEYLADRASIDLPAQEEGFKRSDYQKIKDQKKRLVKINEITKQSYIENLKKETEGSLVKNYLRQRGLTDQVCKAFEVGFSRDSWDALSVRLQKDKAPLKEASDLGLIRQRKNGNGYFDIFRNRLMFPIIAPNGDVVGFGGRVLDPNDNPKYLNSPESKVFHKAKTLYGLHETAKHILTEDQCIVVEGYMDLIALYSVGIKNVVANLGTAFTLDHAKLIGRYTKNVVLLFDGDNAGQIAAERALPIILEAGLFGKSLGLPDKKDPDDFIKEFGVESLKKEISDSDDAYFWYLQRVLKGFGLSPASKIKIIDKVFPVLLKVKDSRLKELYIRETADRISVEEAWLKDTLRQMWRDSSKKSRASSHATPPQAAPENYIPHHELSSENKKLDMSKVPKHELELLKLCLIKEEILKSFLFGNDFAYLEAVESNEIFGRIRQIYGQQADSFDKLPALAVSLLKDPGAIAQATNGELYQDQEKLNKVYQDCIRKLREAMTKKQLKIKLQQIKESQSEEGMQEYMRLVSEYKKLNKEETLK
ncbi:MAG: DNA primase [Bdellovibrionales bacterium]